MTNPAENDSNPKSEQPNKRFQVLIKNPEAILKTGLNYIEQGFPTCGISRTLFNPNDPFFQNEATYFCLDDTIKSFNEEKFLTIKTSLEMSDNSYRGDNFGFFTDDMVLRIKDELDKAEVYSTLKRRQDDEGIKNSLLIPISSTTSMSIRFGINNPDFYLNLLFKPGTSREHLHEYNVGNPGILFHLLSGDAVDIKPFNVLKEVESFPQTLSNYARVYVDIMEAIYAIEGKRPPQETVVFEPLYPVSIKPTNRN